MKRTAYRRVSSYHGLRPLAQRFRQALNSAHGGVRRVAHTRYARQLRRVRGNVAHNAALHGQRVRSATHGLALLAGARMRAHLQRGRSR
jgi:hypothetical protein